MDGVAQGDASEPCIAAQFAMLCRAPTLPSSFTSGFAPTSPLAPDILLRFCGLKPWGTGANFNGSG